MDDDSSQAPRVPDARHMVDAIPGPAWSRGPDGSVEKELLGIAGKRTLEMITDGASLSEILNELCSVIDVYASATSQVLLMDRAGHQLLPLAGPNFPPTVTAAFAPWPIGPNRGCCGTAAFTGERVVISDMSTDPRWPQDDQGEAARRLWATCRLVGTSDFELWGSSWHVLYRIFAAAGSNESGFAINRGCWTYRPHRYRTSPVARSSHYGLRGNQGLRDQSSSGD